MQKLYSKHSLETRILGDKIPVNWAIKLQQNGYSAVSFLIVLFNMHDTDNDGTITLEEYKHVRKLQIFVKSNPSE